MEASKVSMKAIVLLVLFVMFAMANAQEPSMAPTPAMENGSSKIASGGFALVLTSLVSLFALYAH